MARSRRASSSTRAPSKESATSTDESAESTVNNNTKGEHKMSELTQEAIAGLLSGSRTRGAGTEVIKEFIDSEAAGIEVDLNSGALAGKSPGQAYTTLLNAKKRTKTDEGGATVLAMPEAAKVRVIKRNLGTKDNEDWHVFLINTDLVDVAA